MIDRSAYIVGEVVAWPTKERMAEVLREAGLRVCVGRYSIRCEDCSHFVFQEYGGDRGEPCIEADADSIERLLRDGELVSDALARADIRHRLEVHDQNEGVVAYFHHEWPLQDGD